MVTARNLAMAKKHAKEKKFVPSVDKLDTAAVLAATKRNAQTVQVITLPLVRSVESGYLKKVQKL